MVDRVVSEHARQASMGIACRSLVLMIGFAFLAAVLPSIIAGYQDWRELRHKGATEKVARALGLARLLDYASPGPGPRCRNLDEGVCDGHV